MLVAKFSLTFAAASGMIAVVLGAMGSHALKNKIPENLLSAWETGVQYQFYHVFALLVVQLLKVRLCLLEITQPAAREFACVVRESLFAGAFEFFRRVAAKELIFQREEELITARVALASCTTDELAVNAF